MRYRTVDENGDMMPIQTMSQLSEGPEAVALAVDSRLAMLYGEWWENRRLGFKVPEFLISTIRDNETAMLSKYISKYIANTEGVTGISGVITKYSNRKFEYRCRILTRDGSTELEVESDGILRAVY